MQISRIVSDMENTCAHLKGCSNALVDVTQHLNADQEGLVYLSYMLSDHVSEIYRQWETLFRQIQEMKDAHKKL